MERLVVVPNGRLIAAGCLTGVIRASLVVLIAGAVLGPRSFPVDARQPGQGGPGHEENCQRPRRRRAKVVCGRQPTEPCLTRRLMGRGAVAQLAEHLVCNQGVRGSNPLSSTHPDVITEVGCGRRAATLTQLHKRGGDTVVSGNKTRSLPT